MCGLKKKEEGKTLFELFFLSFPALVMLGDQGCDKVTGTGGSVNLHIQIKGNIKYKSTKKQQRGALKQQRQVATIQYIMEFLASSRENLKAEFLGERLLCGNWTSRPAGCLPWRCR